LACAEKELPGIARFNGFLEAGGERPLLFVFEDQAAELFEVLLPAVLKQRRKEHSFFLPLMMPVCESLENRNDVLGISFVERLSLRCSMRHRFENVQRPKDEAVLTLQNITDFHGVHL
jgi:hypothetical protein